MNTNKSLVWSVFKYDDAVKVKCNLCSTFISRGGTGKKASTTPLLNHIRTKHTVEYDKHFSTKKTSYSANDDVDDPDTSSRKRFLSQPTLASVLEKKKLWDINHPKSVELHHAIAQMIAVDNQPHSFVEDEGFRNMMSKAQPQYKIPSREYFKDKAKDVFRMQGRYCIVDFVIREHIINPRHVD
ncbi:hypothetical protein JTE90_028599 [Oedothorax gibbosus]|uniref:BED-type domain-containing protein n=1 Tax=Oedothorax gibbosus TaxID=931172 RepID=A0AAV6TX68_9ARAC|nr:hypothetical protein JTE90_028599 [Oedothorax gibbosus]